MQAGAAGGAATAAGAEAAQSRISYLISSRPNYMNLQNCITFEKNSTMCFSILLV